MILPDGLVFAQKSAANGGRKHRDEGAGDGGKHDDDPHEQPRASGLLWRSAENGLENPDGGELESAADTGDLDGGSEGDEPNKEEKFVEGEEAPTETTDEHAPVGDADDEPLAGGPEKTKCRVAGVGERLCAERELSGGVGDAAAPTGHCTIGWDEPAKGGGEHAGKREESEERADTARGHYPAGGFHPARETGLADGFGVRYESEGGTGNGDESESVEEAFDEQDGELAGDGDAFAAGDEERADGFGGAADDGDGGETDDVGNDEKRTAGIGLEGAHEDTPALAPNPVGGVDDGTAEGDPTPAGGTDLHPEGIPAEVAPLGLGQECPGEGGGEGYCGRESGDAADIPVGREERKKSLPEGAK